MHRTGKRNYNITALQRGLHLLQLFAQSQRGLTAKQVAQLSRLPFSTVHRFLVNLENSGYLNCTGEGGYYLGVACFAVGQAALAPLDIRRLSQPYLRELNQQTRETIHLTVRHGLTAVYVDKLDSPEQLRIHSRIGASVPLHCSAVGKIMLAFMPPEEREKILRQLDLKKFTPNTVGNQQELRTELYRVEKNGYACDLEEHELHIRCIAAPIWDHTGGIHASLSLTAPMVRMPVSRLRQLAPLIQQAGLKISREMGFQPVRDVPANAARKSAPWEASGLAKTS